MATVNQVRGHRFAGHAFEHRHEPATWCADDDHQCVVVFGDRGQQVHRIVLSAVVGPVPGKRCENAARVDAFGFEAGSEVVLVVGRVGIDGKIVRVDAVPDVEGGVDVLREFHGEPQRRVRSGIAVESDHQMTVRRVRPGSVDVQWWQ
ncbi:MAG: hypothetical protein ACI9JD_001677 [Rhodococcus sp. (in: high G+C Gram-positive bacteria)]